MNFGNYTQKSLEAVQSAQSIARSNSHQQMEQVHVLLALLQQEGGLTRQLLKKMENDGVEVVVQIVPSDKAISVSKLAK